MLLYDSFCRIFERPEDFTTTAKLLKSICVDACIEHPNLEIEELIKMNLPLIKTLFTLPSLPTVGHPKFGEWLEKH